MKKRFLQIILAAGLIVTLVTANCACTAKPDVLSEEEISPLRKTYAYAKLDPALDANPPEYINDRHLKDMAFVTVTVNENWVGTETAQMSPGEGLDSTDIAALFLSVHIDSVLKTVNATTNFETGDRILHFATAMASTGYEYFVPGARFVLMITGERDYCPFTNHPNHYHTNVTYAFVLTDDNRLVSLSEFEFLDRYTGWSLDSFSNELNQLSWLEPLSSNSTTE